jgi:hypothetical protein
VLREVNGRERKRSQKGGFYLARSSSIPVNLKNDLLDTRCKKKPDIDNSNARLFKFFFPFSLKNKWLSVKPEKGG